MTQPFREYWLINPNQPIQQPRAQPPMQLPPIYPLPYPPTYIQPYTPQYPPQSTYAGCIQKWANMNLRDGRRFCCKVSQLA
ncbi:hypothetical protein [Kurthia sibirica]|uniref:hypothetical protein n=1 Tax=Kurthia sibirica TaxID=202750 RepID=UPI000D697426|nr:hypothetical protein [Kurthia sibirica]